MTLVAEYMNSFEFIWKLMGSGVQARYEQIATWLAGGGDILSSGGSRVFSASVVSGDVALAQTSYTDVTGLAAPAITWSGLPLLVSLLVPAVQSDTVNAVTTFRVIDGAGMELLTFPIHHPTTTKTYGGFGHVELPLAGQYTPTVGSTVNLKVQYKVSAGTSTMRAYFNNATYGTSAPIFRGMRQ